MKLIPINKGKRRKTRYNSCRTETTHKTHRIKLRIKETIFLFIRNTLTQHSIAASGSKKTKQTQTHTLNS